MHLCDEASIKIPKGFGELLGWWTHPQAQSMVHLTPKGQKLPHPGPSRPRPMYLFIWLFIQMLYYILYSKLVNLGVFLSSVSHPSKLLNLRRGLWEPWFIAYGSEAQVTTWTCHWHLNHWSEGQSCRTEPLTCRSALTLVSVRIEMSGRTPT